MRHGPDNVKRRTRDSVESQFSADYNTISRRLVGRWGWEACGEMVHHSGTKVTRGRTLARNIQRTRTRSLTQTNIDKRETSGRGRSGVCVCVYNIRENERY